MFLTVFNYFKTSRGLGLSFQESNGSKIEKNNNAIANEIMFSKGKEKFITALHFLVSSYFFLYFTRNLSFSPLH